MDELGREFAEDVGERVSGTGIASATVELRKRRSTRIVQAVPLSVAGVDALGRAFTERTSTLIINCHGCRYQSKHYVLKNMWVTLEVPHPETGKPPRTVRGRVAWIQRPRTVRQLFQVALELEVPGNTWGIAFPPEDWFAFPDTARAAVEAGNAAQSGEESPRSADGAEHLHEPPHHSANEADFDLPLSEAEPGAENHAEQVSGFPAPASTTDAAMQLARQVTRLVVDARQQIHAAAREAAAQAVAAERRLTADEWQQKLAADHETLSHVVAAALQQIREESASLNRLAQHAAAEALQRDLPRWLAPQLEELTRDLTAQLSQEALAQRNANTQQTGEELGALQSTCVHAERLLERLREQAAAAEARVLASSESAARAAEEKSRKLEASAGAIEQSVAAAVRALDSHAGAIEERAPALFERAQEAWQNYFAGELEAAQARMQIAMDNAMASGQMQAADSVNAHANSVLEHFQREVELLQASFRDAAAIASAEREVYLSALRDAAHSEAANVEATLARAGEALAKLEQFPERLEAAQQNALGSFQSQLDDVLTLHRNELHRRSDSLFEEISARIHAKFDESTHQAAGKFSEQVESLVQPPLRLLEEGIHRLAGGRSMLDAATSLQQERMRATADEAFAEALANFRGNLGGVEQLLRESADAVTSRSLADLEVKAESARHQVVDDLLKSAEWYEKKAQTQIQHFADRAGEQAEVRLRERAGEISAMFAAELDNASRNFVGHTQNQIEDVVRDAFERARALFSEAAETTSAAFIDEIQRQARNELSGFETEAQKSVNESRAHLEAARADLTQQVTSEQESFLRRFQSAMSGAMEAGVAEANKQVQVGFGPLLDAWKSMTEAQQAEMRRLYAHVGEQAAETFRGRLENVSNQWMLATVASLDHQSREVVSGIAATAEEKLRDTCTKVFSDIGESLRERLTQIASHLGTPPALPH